MYFCHLNRVTKINYDFPMWSEGRRNLDIRENSLTEWPITGASSPGKF